MKDLIQQLKTNYKNGTINIRLIFICVAVFVVTILINLFFFRGGLKIHHFFEAKPSFEQFFSQPWGILTYAFFHGGLLHLALNCLMIYFIGQLFLRYFRKEDFLTFFLFGAISGALFFMCFSYVFNYGQGLVGASAAVYSIFFAMMAYLPHTKIRLFLLNFDIKFIHIGYGLLAFDVLMILADADKNVGGHISHLGGAAFGYFYMKQFEKGNDFLGQIIRSIFYRSKPIRKPKNTYQERRKTPPRDDYEFNAMRNAKQKKVDEILDKISRSGYESLTKEEKDFLFKAGKE